MDDFSIAGGLMSQTKESDSPELDLLGPLEEEELDFFFSRFFGSPYPSIYRKELSWKPLTDFYETNGEYVLLMELAQVRPEEVSIQLQEGVLIVRGVRKANPPSERRRYHKMEINYGPFEQKVAVSDDIDMDKLSSAYREGFLEIRIPKRKPERGPVVEIKVE
jgi:HSP20 family protein